MEPIAGIFPAAMTMFDRGGNLDEAGCRRHLNFLLRSGVHGIVIAGSSGEFIALDDEERRHVLAIAIDEVRRGPYCHVPLYAAASTSAATGCASFTAASCRRSRDCWRAPTAGSAGS
jgi:4-hydroxy-tetrahydrodipicolinate synthase